MKKIALLCLLLIMTSNTFAQIDNPFMDPELFSRGELQNVFEACFVKTTVTSLARKSKNTFKYELTYDAVIIYLHTVFGTSASDLTYSDKWFYIPLKDLYIIDYEIVKDVFEETTEISLTNKAKAIIAGNGTKYNPGSNDTYLQNQVNIPFDLTKKFRNRDVFECLNSNLSVLRGDVKEAVAKKETILPKETKSKPEEPTVKKEYYASGELKSETPMLNGKIEGKKITYYINGKVNYFYNYKNDIENGPYEYYFENGQLRQKSNLKNGQFNGALHEYYENGVLKNESVNIDGKYDGFVYKYDRNGKLTEKEYYVMGRKSGLLDICEGAGLLIKKLDDGQDEQLDDAKWMEQNFDGIKDFKYTYFSEGSYILNRSSHCRLDYLPKEASTETLFLQYEKIKTLLNSCGKLKAEEEHSEKSGIGALKSKIYRYNKSLFIKIEAMTISGGSVRLYVCRIENKKNGIR